MRFNLKPALVLSAITAVIGALLIVCTNLIPDTSGVISEKLRKKCEELMGPGEFGIINTEMPDNVKKIIKKQGGGVAFEVSVKGYNDGYDLLVAMNTDGSVTGVTVISSNETKNVGEDFYKKFGGVKGEVTIVKSAPKSDNEIQATTGATVSSKSVAKAVNIAVKAYAEMENNNGE